YKKTREERMHIPGMIEMRVDMIVVASILTSYILQKLKLKHIRISTYALKEGVLCKVVNGEEL
ncbi:MAG TPA: phosphatase, partial [Cytophagaceae bacterium]